MMTEAELLQALLAAEPRAGATAKDAFTTEEIAEMAQLPRTTVQRRVRAMCRAGTMEGFRDWRETSCGHMQRYPVFRVVRHD